MEHSASELGIRLDSRAVGAFERHYRVLTDWNRRVNLTSIEGEEEAAVKHFLDSLTCLLAVDLPEGCKVVDVGSGAGFPGVVLKVARTGINLALVEASRKRADFLRDLVAVLGLDGVEVLWDRAERLGRAPAHRESYDVATARAVGEMAVLAELCLPLVRVGGVFVAQKGPDAREEMEASTAAVEAMGGLVERVVPVSLPFGYGGRTVVVVRKESETPPCYPRRPGIPEKRPIKGSRR
ncbi:MAG: 16S rRNA (guanine(527)-N(7))-methyltransferase RsmG [Betaproteobacteria bacterium]